MSLQTFFFITNKPLSTCEKRIADSYPFCIYGANKKNSWHKEIKDILKSLGIKVKQYDGVGIDPDLVFLVTKEDVDLISVALSPVIHGGDFYIDGTVLYIYNVVYSDPQI